MADVEEKIKSGVPLSEAFEAQGIFPKIYTASLLAGEKSGAFDDVLARYVDYLKRSVGVARKLRGAFAYPAFLLAAAIFMVAFLTLYIVPRMSDLFKGLSTKQRFADDYGYRFNFFVDLLPIISGGFCLFCLVLVFAIVIWLQNAERKT